MRVRVIVVGRAAGPLRDAIQGYESRAGRYWPLEVVEVRAEPARGRPETEVRRLEAERVAAQARGVLVVLDERGRHFTSAEFSRWLHLCRERAEDVSLVIGGAFGVDDSLRTRAALLLSVSPWTLSHDLARLVLAEQLYRAGTIVRGEPYHKA